MCLLDGSQYKYYINPTKTCLFLEREKNLISQDKEMRKKQERVLKGKKKNTKGYK